MPTVASGPVPPLEDTGCSLLLPPQPSTLIASSPESFSLFSNCLCRDYTCSTLGSQAEHYRGLSFQPAPATWPRPSMAPLVTSPVQKVHRNPGSLSQAPGHIARFSLLLTCIHTAGCSTKSPEVDGIIESGHHAGSGSPQIGI